MKLVSFRHKACDSYGIVAGDGVIDAGRRLGARLPTLRTALEALDELRALSGEVADIALSEIEFLQPITDPGRITCIGMNYKKHIEEVGGAVPEFPSMFSHQPHCQVGHLGEMVRPKVSDNYDFEGELAFVIGKAGRHIAKDRALEHVAGYSILNDGSLRDFQFQHSLLAGKNFWHAGAFGPWLVTADELPDPSALTLTTRLNGDVVQHSPTADLLFTVQDLIVYLSRIWPMEVGDVVATGTPSGVGLGRTPNLWMKPGDEIEVEISGIGILKNAVVAE